LKAFDVPLKVIKGVAVISAASTQHNIYAQAMKPVFINDSVLLSAFSGFRKNKVQTGFISIDPPSPHQARIRVSGDSLHTLLTFSGGSPEILPLAAARNAPIVFVSEYVEEKQKIRTTIVGPSASSVLHASHCQSRHGIESSTCFSSSDIVRGGLVSDRFDGVKVGL